MTPDESLDSEEIKEVKADLGFHFTPEDYYRIHLAGLSAAEYMETYGQGRQPYDIDLKQHSNGNKNNQAD